MRILGLIFKILIFPFKYFYVLLHIIARWSFPLFLPLGCLGNIMALMSAYRHYSFLTALIYFIIFVLPFYLIFIKGGPTFILYSKYNKTLFKYYFFGHLEYKLHSLAYDLFVIWYVLAGSIFIAQIEFSTLFEMIKSAPKIIEYYLK